MSVQNLLLLQAGFSPSRCHITERLTDWLSTTKFNVDSASWPSAMRNLNARVCFDRVIVHHAQSAEAQRSALQVSSLLPNARILALCCERRYEANVHASCPASGIQMVCCAAPTALSAVADWLRTQESSGPLPEVLPGVIGISPAIVAAARQVPLLAGSDATCVLLGETGTGKELFARSLHYLSVRLHHPFVPLNCGAIAEHLFENELFGHVRGAYTDARSQESGLLAYAEGGTLFLDEVDALSPSAQVKLLRLLQEHEYRPVGSARSVRSNVRVVAATNSNLAQLVAERRFREDLYHRLNVLRLTIPPLRERVEDIPLLTCHFVREFSGQPLAILTGEAVERLTAYRWPGNVRELQGVLQRWVLLHGDAVLDADSLDLPATAACKNSVEGTTPGGPPGQAGGLCGQTLKAAKDDVITQFERGYLTEVLQRCEGNVSRAARIAGKERRSFQRLLRKYNVNFSPLTSRPGM